MVSLRTACQGSDSLAPPIDLSETLNAIGEDVMTGYSSERAMRDFCTVVTVDTRAWMTLAR